MTLQVLVRSIIIVLFFTGSVTILVAPEFLPSVSQSFAEIRHLLIAGAGMALYLLDDYLSRWKSCISTQAFLSTCGCH
jgi:hypothetical protein